MEVTCLARNNQLDEYICEQKLLVSTYVNFCFGLVSNLQSRLLTLYLSILAGPFSKINISFLVRPKGILKPALNITMYIYFNYLFLRYYRWSIYRQTTKQNCCPALGKGAKKADGVASLDSDTYFLNVVGTSLFIIVVSGHLYPRSAHSITSKGTNVRSSDIFLRFRVSSFPVGWRCICARGCSPEVERINKIPDFLGAGYVR